jgi:hypothetical protein
MERRQYREGAEGVACGTSRQGAFEGGMVVVHPNCL